MKVLILGLDGYLGWATAMYLSEQGHEVVGVDNYLKRHLMEQYQIEPLSEVPFLGERVEAFKQKTGLHVEAIVRDISEPIVLRRLIAKHEPDVIIHYGEQPSAPFSMIGEEQAMNTVRNNVDSTLRLIYAVRDENPDIHIIKLGTMGEYGCPDTPIPEGWFECEYKGRSGRMLFPKTPHSMYHLSKVHDSDALAFAARMWGIRVTDLNQGVVYGLYGEDELQTRFTYDDIFGTVINRFIAQAVAGIPLTVYGEGGQTRGYLNILDTLQCVELAMNHPADHGEFRVFNQFTEQFTVNQLADKVRQAGVVLGMDVKIDHIQNPRTEKERHFYDAEHTGLFDLGLKPHLMDTMTLVQMLEHVRRYPINTFQIQPRVKWS